MRVRQELEQIRQAEADQRKMRERDRQQIEENERKSDSDRQHLLEKIERPLGELLDKMGLWEELGMPLAKADVISLKRLLSTPRHHLIKSLALNSLTLDSLDRVVIAARRSVAMERITTVKLSEDAQHEEDLALKREAEAEAARQAETSPAQTQWQRRAAEAKAAQQAAQKSQDSDRSDADAKESPTHHAAREPVVKPPLGPLRKALIAVVDRWYDYLSTQTALGELLARAGTETLPRGDDDGTCFGGPTWKHTVSWALWMLTVPRVGSSSASDSSSASTIDGLVRMGRRSIEHHLKLAQDHVWKALYPGLQKLSVAEWRVYWQRVATSFTGFFSSKGTDRWKEAAALDARAAAVRAGKSLAEQNAAALQAERLVMAMLKVPQKPKPPPPDPESQPVVPAPSGMALNLAHASQTKNNSGSIPVKVNLVKPAGDAPVTGSATWPPPSRPLAAVIATSAQYKATPSRYLQPANHTRPRPQSAFDAIQQQQQSNRQQQQLRNRSAGQRNGQPSAVRTAGGQPSAFRAPAQPSAFRTAPSQQSFRGPAASQPSFRSSSQQRTRTPPSRSRGPGGPGVRRVDRQKL